jgi:hypothetical protein
MSKQSNIVNASQDITVDSSGNVQIGNNSSVTGGRYLDIYNTASGATDFSILRFITQQAGSSSTTSADIYKRKNGQFTISNGETNPSAFTSFNVGASERVRIDSSGRVGINTTSPDFALHVQDAGSNTAATVKLGDVYHGYVQQNANDLNIISNGDQAYRASVGTNNGTGNIVFQTAHATTGNTEHMRINSAGVITTPNQPLCSMNNGAGWLTMVANTVYGVGASYAANRGGFYAGASLGGYPVTHVPATGLYRVTLHAYVTANQSGRLSLRANQSTLLCFLQIPSIPSHTALTENIVYLNAYDYLDYVADATMNLYHADLHTYVTLEFLG